MKHFTSSIQKYNKDGDIVISDHLAEGERLVGEEPETVDEENTEGFKSVEDENTYADDEVVAGNPEEVPTEGDEVTNESEEQDFK